LDFGCYIPNSLIEMLDPEIIGLFVYITLPFMSKSVLLGGSFTLEILFYRSSVRLLEYTSHVFTRNNTK